MSECEETDTVENLGSLRSYTVFKPFFIIAFWFCDWKTSRWFKASHPFWDCKTGRPKEWSIKKYGLRPHDMFYEKWEQRRQFFIQKLGRTELRLDEIERKKVKEEYGI